MMWRYLVGGLAALLFAVAGVTLFKTGAKADPVAALPPRPPQSASEGPLPDTAPEASERTREQKRFDRYDKDRDGGVTREEYLAQRRKAYAKLDANHDGQLSFDEWAIKATTKFAAADRDKSAIMNPAEFATTAVKRKTAVRAKCPPVQAGNDEG